MNEINQELIDLIFSITINIHEHSWFKEKNRTRDEVQNWVSEQLKNCSIYTFPSGSSWGVLTTKEFYEENIKNDEK